MFSDSFKGRRSYTPFTSRTIPDMTGHAPRTFAGQSRAIGASHTKTLGRAKPGDGLTECQLKQANDYGCARYVEGPTIALRWQETRRCAGAHDAERKGTRARKTNDQPKIIETVNAAKRPRR